MSTNRKRSWLGNFILNLLLLIVVVAIVALIYFFICYKGYYVVGSSMEPTLAGAIDEETQGGDYVFAKKNRTPSYGDVVIIQTEDKDIIKRVIAKAGDTVMIEDGTVYVQYSSEGEFTALEEDYVLEDNNDNSYALATYEAHTVAEDCIYCLGDNRNVSNDSRINGDYSLEDVLGVVPEWIISAKNVTTGIYTFFKFTI